MPYTAFINKPNMKHAPKSSKRYVKNVNTYASPNPLFKYISVDIGEVKNATKDLTENLTSNEKDTRNISPERFIKGNTQHYLDITIKSNSESDYKVVEIRNKEMKLEELFELARVLNRKALKEELGFIVIAGA